ncbi:MAG TPA: hypothetical protein VF190_06685 [Rhodothermales bacterium]
MKGRFQIQLLALALLLAIGACDSQSNGGSTDDEQNDFFPLAQGKMWTYEYLHWSNWTGFDPTETLCAGTVELEVTGVGLAGTARQAKFEERRDLIREYRTYLWDGTRYVGRDTVRTVFQDTLRYTLLQREGDTFSHPFIEATIVATHDVAPDTVDLDLIGTVAIPGDEDGSCDATARVTLVRGLGITRFTYNCGDLAVEFIEGGERRLVTP